MSVGLRQVRVSRELHARETELEALGRVARELSALSATRGSLEVLAPLSDVGFVPATVADPGRALVPLGGEPPLFAWQSAPAALAVVGRRREFLRGEMERLEATWTALVEEQALAKLPALFSPDAESLAAVSAAGAAQREADGVVDISLEGAEAEEHEEALRKDVRALSAQDRARSSGPPSGWRPASGHVDVRELFPAFDTVEVNEVVEELLEEDGLPPTVDDATFQAYMERARRIIAGRRPAPPSRVETETATSSSSSDAAFTGVVVERRAPTSRTAPGPGEAAAAKPVSKFRAALRK